MVLYPKALRGLIASFGKHGSPPVYHGDIN